MRWARLWRRLRGGGLTRARAAASVGVGLWVGCLPLYGLHFPLCLAITLPLSLDLVLAYLAANVSNPLFAPFLVYAEVQVGALLLDGHFAPFSLEHARAAGVTGFLTQALVGSLAVGTTLGLVGAAITLLVVRRERPPRPMLLDDALSKTLARYARAPRRDRVYLASKLFSDPLYLELAQTGESLGDVLDVATGRGQTPLLLLELGRARSVVGFDWDERKIAVAAAAAGGAGTFEVADVTALSLPSADSVLLVDVLHYLAEAERKHLLEAVTRALRAGGRVLVRELDPGRGLPSRIGIWAERLAARSGMNRGATLSFLGPEALCRELGRVGLVATPAVYAGRLSPNYSLWASLGESSPNLASSSASPDQSS